MTAEKIYELNQNDLSNGVKLLMARGQDHRPISQSMLSQFSGVGNDVVSKIINPYKNKGYSPTLRTISKIAAVWEMTFVDFYKFVEENTVRF